MIARTRPAGAPDLEVVGSAGGPRTLPVQTARVQLYPNGAAAYESLFCTLDASGQPQAVVFGGTYGALVPAGRR